MTAFTIAALLQFSVVTSAAQSYGDAYQASADSGRPLLVMVGAEWCPGCVTMKQSVIPQVERNGALKEVAFAYVNTDQQGRLAKKLMRGGSIPQLIAFRKTRSGWQREQLTGAQSASAVESFIRTQCEKSSEPVEKLSSYLKQ